MNCDICDDHDLCGNCYDANNYETSCHLTIFSQPPVPAVSQPIASDSDWHAEPMENDTAGWQPEPTKDAMDWLPEPTSDDATGWQAEPTDKTNVPWSTDGDYGDSASVNHKIYVTGIKYSATQAEVHSFFQDSFGEVNDVHMIATRGGFDGHSGRCVVTFASGDSAVAAIKAAHPTDPVKPWESSPVRFQDRPLIIVASQPRTRVQGSTSNSNSNGCFNCGAEGHKRHECPDPPRSESNKRACFKCGDEDHISKDCPQQTSTETRTCRICNVEGHIAKYCPDEGSSRGPKRERRPPPKTLNDATSIDTAGRLSKFDTQGTPYGQFLYAGLAVSGGQNSSPNAMLTPAAGFTRGDVNVEVSTDLDGKQPISVPDQPTDYAWGTHIPDMTLLSKLNSMYPEGALQVQARTLQYIHQGHSVTVAGAFGSGKSTAFVTAAISTAISARSEGSAQTPEDTSGRARPSVVFIAPTRELAIANAQLAYCIITFENDQPQVNVRVALAYGGLAWPEQAASLKHGCDILFGSPGRLMDLCSSKDERDAYVDLSGVRLLVIDEAPIVLGDDYMEHVDGILKPLSASKNYRTLIGGSSLPPAMKNALMIREGIYSEEEKKSPNNLRLVYYSLKRDQATNLAISFIECATNNQDERFEAFQKIMSELALQPTEQVVVYCRSRERTAALYEMLTTTSTEDDVVMPFPSTVMLHGAMYQAQRENAMNLVQQSSSEVAIMFTTTVGGLGINYVHSPTLIMYDLPCNMDCFSAIDQL